MTNPAIASTLLEILKGYVFKLHRSDSQVDLLAITGSILTYQQKQGNWAIAPEQAEDIIQQVVQAFNPIDLKIDPQGMADHVLNAATQDLVEQIDQWRGNLENQVLNTVNAYVQQFLPSKNLDLCEIVLSIIPLVEPIQLRRAEAESLIEQVKSRFSWQSALDQAIGTEASAIAQQLAKLLQYGNLEKLVKETVVAYHHGIEQTLATVTESLVQSALSQVLGNAVQFNLDTDIDLQSQKFLVKQMTLKLNLLDSPIHPSKSAREVAALIQSKTQTEIERFKAERRGDLGAIDLTKPAILGDLEVGIP
jgi:hypothetical protein